MYRQSTNPTLPRKTEIGTKYINLKGKKLEIPTSIFGKNQRGMYIPENSEINAHNKAFNCHIL